MFAAGLPAQVGLALTSAGVAGASDTLGSLARCAAFHSHATRLCSRTWVTRASTACPF